MQLTACMSDWWAASVTSCLFDWLTGWPSNWKASRLSPTDRLNDWYADFTDRLTGRWHATDWQMSRQSVGGQSGRLGGWCWCVGRWPMRSCSCCWRQQERRMRWRARVRERESTMFSCEAKIPPGFLRVYLDASYAGSAIITSGCQHETANRSEISASSSGVCVCTVCMLVHIPLLRVVSMQVWGSMCALCEPGL